MPATAIGETLAALARAFARLDRRWYLFGAQAVLLYGRPRLTADVDVTLDASPSDLASLLDALRGEGFESRLDEDVEGVAARTRVVPLVHRSFGIPVDVVLAGPSGPEREFLDQAVLQDVAGVEVPVMAPEDLIASKILSGRPKDLEDAQGVVEEQNERLDVDRIRRWLGLFETALSRSDLTPELDRLLRAAWRAPSTPREQSED